MESSPLMRRIIEGYVNHNNLKNQIIIVDESSLDNDDLSKKLTNKVIFIFPSVFL